jgi:CMD domain protein
MTTTTSTDVINQLAGIPDDSPLGQLRSSREVAFNAAQGSFQALLEPEPNELGGVSRLEREAIVYRIALLERSAPVVAHHRARLEAAGATPEEIAAIELFPERDGLPPHLVAILDHTDLLTKQPKAASPEALKALREAGLSTRDIVTVSQLIAFASFQVRLLTTLRILKEEQA